MTARQLKIYEFIIDFIDSKGYSPSLREIADGNGLRSIATVHKHLKALRAEGHIRNARRGHARSYEPEVYEHVCPSCGSRSNLIMARGGVWEQGAR